MKKKVQLTLHTRREIVPHTDSAVAPQPAVTTSDPGIPTGTGGDTGFPCSPNLPASQASDPICNQAPLLISAATSGIGSWIARDITDNPQPFAAYGFSDRQNVGDGILRNSVVKLNPPGGAMADYIGWQPRQLYPREVLIGLHFPQVASVRIFGSGDVNSQLLNITLSQEWGSDYPDGGFEDWYTHGDRGDVVVMWNRDDTDSSAAAGKSFLFVSTTLSPAVQIPTITTGQFYWLKCRRDETSISAKWWNRAEDEPTGWLASSVVPVQSEKNSTVIRPGFSITLDPSAPYDSDNPNIGDTSIVAIDGIWLDYPPDSQPLLAGQDPDCGATITGSGLLATPLTRNSAGEWYVANNAVVSEWKSVYFNGVYVSEGTSYTISSDGQRIIPITPLTSSDDVTAEFTATTVVTQPPVTSSPSGIAVRPVKSGWTRVAFSHFDDDIALGTWTGDLQNALIPRPDAAHDETFVDSSGRSIYSARKTISQHDSFLDCKLWQDASGQRWSGAPINKGGFYPSLRVTEVTKVDAPEDGWKMAHLVAVGGSNVSSRGEYDMPECKFGSSPQVSAFMHQVGGAQIAFNIEQALGHAGAIYEWHEYTIEVVSGQWVDYFIDGQLLVNESGVTKLVDPTGRHSVTTGVTSENVHWVLQNETFLSGQTIPDVMGDVHILTDWVSIEVPA